MTIETQDTDKETSMLNTMKIIWLGLFFYPVVLVFVAFKVLAPAEIQSTPLELIFQVMAIAVLIASHVLPKLVNKKYQLKLKEGNSFETLKAYFFSFILSLALSDSVIIFGFLLVTLTHDPMKMLPFAIAGMLNMLSFFPRKEKILMPPEKIN